MVITGGHLDGNDVLYDGSIEIIEGELIESENVHGSGCVTLGMCSISLKRLFHGRSCPESRNFTKKY